MDYRKATEFGIFLTSRLFPSSVQASLYFQMNLRDTELLLHQEPSRTLHCWSKSIVFRTLVFKGHVIWPKAFCKCFLHSSSAGILWFNYLLSAIPHPSCTHFFKPCLCCFSSISATAPLYHTVAIELTLQWLFEVRNHSTHTPKTHNWGTRQKIRESFFCPQGVHQLIRRFPKLNISQGSLSRSGSTHYTSSD